MTWWRTPGVARMSRRLLIPVVVGLVVADSTTTALGLRLGAEEAVPGSRLILDTFGEIAMHAVAAILIAVAVVGVEWGRRYLSPNASAFVVVALALVLGVKAVAIVNNLIVLGSTHG